MRVFADTNFFTHLWMDLAFKSEAERLLQSLHRAGAVLPVTRMLRMELTNALQRLIYETRHGTQIVHVSPEAALVARGVFDDETRASEFLRWQSVSEETLEIAFETLAYRHTAKHGFRTYDILHVASALMLGCDTFWTFDERAKKLARLEGMQTN
jgi:predicted nucleic acid-binding protein